MRVGSTTANVAKWFMGLFYGRELKAFRASPRKASHLNSQRFLSPFNVCTLTYRFETFSLEILVYCLSQKLDISIYALTLCRLLDFSSSILG